METRFELRLHSQLKASLGTIVTVLAVPGVFVAVVVNCAASSWTVIGLLGAMVSAGALGYCFTRWWAVYRTVVEVEHNQLIIQRADATSVLIPFAELASYRYEPFNDRHVLCFRLVDGRKIKLVANAVFGKVGNFLGLAQSIEQAIVLYQTEHGTLITREKTFFEKPIATILLSFCGALLIIATLMMIRGATAFNGSIFTSYGLFLTYLAGWLAARKRRP